MTNFEELNMDEVEEVVAGGCTRPPHCDDMESDTGIDPAATTWNE